MMAEKEKRTVERAADFERQVREMYTAGVPDGEYNELEHLKQQYIDGELTESEFEARLEQLDDLSPTPEPDRREIDVVRQNLIRGAAAGGVTAIASAVSMALVIVLGGGILLGSIVCIATIIAGLGISTKVMV